MLLTYAYGYFGGEQMAEYKAFRQYGHLILALGSVVAVVIFWLWPPKIWPSRRNHGLILALLFCLHAGFGYWKPLTGQEWVLKTCWYLVGSLGCAGLWMWKGMLR